MKIKYVLLECPAHAPFLVDFRKQNRFLNSVQTRCTVKGKTQKSPLFCLPKDISIPTKRVTRFRTTPFKILLIWNSSVSGEATRTTRCNFRKLPPDRNWRSASGGCLHGQVLREKRLISLHEKKGPENCKNEVKLRSSLCGPLKNSMINYPFLFFKTQARNPSRKEDQGWFEWGGSLLPKSCFSGVYLVFEGFQEREFMEMLAVSNLICRCVSRFWCVSEKSGALLFLPCPHKNAVAQLEAEQFQQPNLDPQESLPVLICSCGHPCRLSRWKTLFHWCKSWAMKKRKYRWNIFGVPQIGL